MSEFLISAGQSRRSGTLLHLLSTLWIWVERSRQRKQLAALDNHLLSDIGLDRQSRDIEVAKPFWRA